MSLLLHLSFDAPGAAPPALPLPTPGMYARMMMALLPPGRLRRLIGSLLSDLFTACADELDRLHARASDLLNEADPSTAIELLPEYERELELESTGTIEERQARVVAQTIADQGVRPADFQQALAPLLGQDPEDVVVIETSHALAASMGDDREIKRFFIYRDPGLPGTYYLASAQAQLDKMNRSTCVGHVIESVAAKYDDSTSLYSGTISSSTYDDPIVYDMGRYGA